MKPPPPQQIWKFTTGGEIWSSPVIHAGSILLGSDDGNIYSVNRATGEQDWKFATDGRVRSRGAICGGEALFAGDDGNLYALEAGSGAEMWRFDLGSAEISRRLPATDPPYDYDYLASSPVCSGGTVYTGSADGHLYAVDAATGTMRWRFKTGGKVRATPLVHQGHVYTGSWDQQVYALDADSGEEIWKFDTGGIVQASPAYGAGKIFIGSRSPKVFALDAGTGTPIWEYVHEDGSWVESSAVFADGTIYIGSSDALALQSLDPATGVERWRFETGGWSWSTPLVNGDTVYIGAISASPYYFEGVTLKRSLHAVDRRTGVKKWSIDTGELSGSYITGGVHATPVIADGVIYVAALDGRLYALRW
jgi:outer membrane protein assembly factor BamB